jgi:hypothetical protein
MEVVAMLATNRHLSVLWTLTGAALAIVLLPLFQAWPSDAGGTGESTFTPVTPCRLFDLRPAPDNIGNRSTPLGPDESYAIQVTGSNGQCTGIPSDATGVAMNVTVVNPTEASFLSVVPGDVTGKPDVSSLNYLAGAPPTPNKVDVALDDGGAIRIYNRFGQVYVLADVVGYYSDTALETLRAEIAALRLAQPFVVNDSVDDDVELTDEFQTVASVVIVAPVPGNVSVVAAANVDQIGVVGADVGCEINTATSGPGMELWFERDQASNSGNVAGTRVFEIAKGATETYRLQCYEQGDGGILDQAEITAVFTPAP